MNWHRFGKKYDFDSPRQMRRSLRFLCEQLVHSYVFAPVLRKNGGLDSILFNSDRTRHKSLFSITVGVVASLFNEIGTNDPASASMVLDPKIGDFQVWVGPSMPDPAD